MKILIVLFATSFSYNVFAATDIENISIALECANEVEKCVEEGEPLWAYSILNKELTSKSLSETDRQVYHDARGIILFQMMREGRWDAPVPTPVAPFDNNPAKFDYNKWIVIR